MAEHKVWWVHDRNDEGEGARLAQQQHEDERANDPVNAPWSTVHGQRSTLDAERAGHVTAPSIYR